MLSANHKLRRNLFLSALLSLCMAGQTANVGLAQEAAAQPAGNYKTVPLDEKYAPGSKLFKELQTAKKEAFRGTFDIQPIRNYYIYCLMPQFTSLEDPLAINKVVDFEIRQDIESAQKLSPANCKAFNDQLFTMLSGIAGGNYRPSAVINATILIGTLNDARSSSSAAPVPYARATGFLLNACEKGANDGVKAAALVGMERHVRLLSASWDDRTREVLATKFVGLAKAPKPPAQSDEAHAYLASRYLQILELFKHSKGPDVTQFALDTLANENTHPILREQALLIVGRLSPVEAAEAKKIAAGRYTLRYMKKRLEDWRDLNDMSTSASSGGSGGGGYGGGGGGYGAGYGDSGGMAANYGGGGSAYGGQVEQEKKAPENPFKDQDPQVVFLRRYMHELAQKLRLGISGQEKGDVATEFEKGLLVGIPEGDERALLIHTITMLREVQVALNDETLKNKSDINSKIVPIVEKLIATAEDYPGAVDAENEPIIEEAETAPAEVADASAAADAAVNVQPAGEAEGEPDKQ